MQGTLDQDIAFPPGPTDTVNALRWSPKANHVAAASWDGKVYIYDATNVAAGTSTIQAVTAMDNSLHHFLDCDFNQVSFDENKTRVNIYQLEGNMIAGASTDHKIHIMDLNSPGQTMKLAGHESTVRTVRWLDIPCAPNPTSLLISGSWDRTLRFWDPKRQPNPIAAVTLSERVWTMDGSGTALIAGTADNKVHIFNLGKITENGTIRATRIIDSPLGDPQIKCLAVLHGGERWAVGSIGGRVTFQQTALDLMGHFSFSCHRKTTGNTTEVYSVNAIAFARPLPPSEGGVGRTVMATAGQDGHVNLWDLNNKHKLIEYPSVGGSITACGFNWDATMFAYAVGYDWGKGFAGNTADHPLGLALRKVDKSLLG
ncbi:WD40-repeat-containing domain protein [Cercophora samala]|uniref:WD40-repeat-containing domain protein n=1 Tax=Cercophora samala TaxID=330535 RepID=A0AA39ZMI3_9PEZI|nr:WD40-repeat-containing domain protein [Cercophora samala]